MNFKNSFKILSKSLSPEDAVPNKLYDKVKRLSGYSSLYIPLSQEFVQPL